MITISAKYTQSDVICCVELIAGYVSIILRCQNCMVPTYNFQYNDIIMDAMASQITSLTIVYSTFYSGAGQRKHQSSA